jgi:hypothetical protein
MAERGIKIAGYLPEIIMGKIILRVAVLQFMKYIEKVTLLRGELFYYLLPFHLIY